MNWRGYTTPFTNWIAGRFRRNKIAANVHKSVVEPSSGVTPRMIPSAIVSAIFSGDTPWRSSWMKGFSQRGFDTGSVAVIVRKPAGGLARQEPDKKFPRTVLRDAKRLSPSGRL